MCPQLENPLEVVTNTLREQIQYKPEETGRSAQYYNAMIRQVIRYHYNLLTTGLRGRISLATQTFPQ